ncbi:Methionine ABC transporter ATP-binding protein [Salmonella enterica subsp. enterica serovar Senftenberg str. A4-543]|uniref:Methionine ABC transporter ATP-binding protein n=1 Tax=Salmonella enterica subsp. enterica serovar Senftenberg str. A4-543 TaxID=913082 RepID=G5QV18_SALSE|nr:Methionine ABC transporter ATP-binding protein [Salmonella enterica subsp. enterica serovar Senftenberg str. A4-543]
MIKLSNITKVFQQGTRTIQALNNVSLHVPAGQIYGVIGASGAPVKVRSFAVRRR